MSTPTAESKRYLILYASGSAFIVEGTFQMIPLESWMIPAVSKHDGPLVVLDQRAIVSCAGVTVYSPRRNRDGLQPVMREWLDEHPEWDAIVKETT